MTFKMAIFTSILIAIICPTVIIYADMNSTMDTSYIEPVIVDFTPVTIEPLLNKGQVEQFMLSDATDQHPYTEDYKCGSFAEDVIANASAMGIEANYIIVKWEGSYIVHAIVMFPTIEDGDVYVDATSGDWWVDFSFGDNAYNSYLMTEPNHCGFCNETLDIYGIKTDEGITWLSNPYPTATSTPTPTPTLTPTPTPAPTSTILPAPTTFYPVIEDIPTDGWLLNRGEVRAFMLADKTSDIVYSYPWFVCQHFAQAVAWNATDVGIACYPVYINLVWYGLHAIVAFPTIQDGWVFVDATCGDWWVEMELGEGRYRSYDMVNPNKHWFYDETLLHDGYYIMYY